MSKLYLVRKAAKDPRCPFTEYRLRLMIAEGSCPGVKVGNRFMVDLDMLEEMTRAAAAASVRKEA